MLSFTGEKLVPEKVSRDFCFVASEGYAQNAGLL